jgi:hypothetical protein
MDTMFGRSKKTPKPPNPVRLLTTEYLLDGYDDDQYSLLNYSTINEDLDNIVLDSVQVQPLGDQQIASFTCQKWFGYINETTVAIIPRDEEGFRLVREAWSENEYPFKAEIFAGPYIIRGTIMSDDEDGPIIDINQYLFLLVTDVEIESQVPGSKLGQLRSPVALINGMLIHGFYLI